VVSEGEKAGLRFEMVRVYVKNRRAGGFGGKRDGQGGVDEEVGCRSDFDEWVEGDAEDEDEDELRQLQHEILR
jgi:hypothetical protein